VELVGGAREAALPGDGREVAKLAKLDAGLSITNRDRREHDLVLR
jgi:hypothetical protein